MIDEQSEIEELLASYHADTLAEMAERAGIPLLSGKGRPKKALVMDRLRAEFFTRERVLASLERLSARDRAVLDRLMRRGGTAPTREFRRELVRNGLAEDTPRERDGRARNAVEYLPYAGSVYIGRPERTESPVFADVMARLAGHGLVFSRLAPPAGYYSIPAKLQFHPADELFIPQAILQYLPPPQPLTKEPPLQPQRVEEAEPALLLRDLYLYWDFCRRNPVALTQAGFVGKRSLRAINNVLLVPDPLLDHARNEGETGRLALLGELLGACGLLVREAGYLQPAPPGAYPVPEFWGKPEAEQLAACLSHWLRLPPLSDLNAEARRYEPSVERGRRVLLQVLRQAPVGVWLSYSDLLEQVRIADSTFLYTNRYLPAASYGMGAYSYGRADYMDGISYLATHFDEWEAEFVERCLAGFLFQVGVLDLGYDGDLCHAVRVTPLGRVLLQRVIGAGEEQAGPAAAAEDDRPEADGEEGKVIVQPSFQILAMGPVSLAVLAHLDLLAERQRAGQGAFEYLLTREGVYRAQQAGMDAAAVVSFLEQTSAFQLPQNVRRSLNEWATHQERIVFRRGVSLMQTVRPELLDELVQDAQTGAHIARIVTPQVAILQQSEGQALVQALVARDQFPTVCGARPESADRSVTVEEDGAVNPVHAVPSLFLTGRLQRLAEQGPDGTWRLTAASIARAGGTKTRVLRLLAELERLHRGELPQKLVEQVKAWGGYYGDAAAQTLTLLEFRDLDTLAELLEHPALRALLSPFPAGDRALASVASDDLAQVKGILAGLGVRVRDGLSGGKIGSYH